MCTLVQTCLCIYYITTTFYYMVQVNQDLPNNCELYASHSFQATNDGLNMTPPRHLWIDMMHPLRKQSPMQRHLRGRSVAGTRASKMILKWFFAGFTINECIEWCMDLGCNKQLLAIDLDDCKTLDWCVQIISREVRRKPTGMQFNYTTRKVDKWLAILKVGI